MLQIFCSFPPLQPGRTVRQGREATPAPPPDLSPSGLPPAAAELSCRAAAKLRGEGGGGNSAGKAQHAARSARPGACGGGAGGGKGLPPTLLFPPGRKTRGREPLLGLGPCHLPCPPRRPDAARTFLPGSGRSLSLSLPPPRQRQAAHCIYTVWLSQ